MPSDHSYGSIPAGRVSIGTVGQHQESAPDEEGAFECRPDTVLRWDGHDLGR